MMYDCSCDMWWPDACLPGAKSNAEAGIRTPMPLPAADPKSHSRPAQSHPTEQNVSPDGHRLTPDDESGTTAGTTCLRPAISDLSPLDYADPNGRRRGRWLYVIARRCLGEVKIGIATNVYSRFGSIQAANAGALSLWLVVPGDRSTENQAHALFDHIHIRGEWFRDHPDLRKWVLACREEGRAVWLNKGASITTKEQRAHFTKLFEEWKQTGVVSTPRRRRATCAVSRPTDPGRGA